MTGLVSEIEKHRPRPADCFLNEGSSCSYCTVKGGCYAFDPADVSMSVDRLLSSCEKKMRQEVEMRMEKRGDERDERTESCRVSQRASSECASK